MSTFSTAKRKHIAEHITNTVPTVMVIILDSFYLVFPRGGKIKKITNPTIPIAPITNPSIMLTTFYFMNLIIKSIIEINIATKETPRTIFNDD